MDIDIGALQAAPAGQREVRFDLLVAGDAGHPGDGYRMRRPAAVRAEFRNTGKSVRAQVSAHLDLACACDRCLEPFAFGVDVAYAEEFLTPAQAAAVGVQGNGDDDDGGVRRVVYRGDRVSLDEGFWENVQLALPMKRLCRPDCRGICPHCGRDRNLESCTCTGGEVDPRLAALEALLPRKEGR